MKKVTIYTTPTCASCKAAKALFKEHNIAYTEYDVTADREKAQEMIRKSGQMGVPVIFVDNPSNPSDSTSSTSSLQASSPQAGQAEMTLGFDENRLKQLLEIT